MDDYYMKRVVDNDLKRYLNIKGAILITGPKWCGKTTTAKQFANSILKLDDIDKREEYMKLADIRPSELLKGDNPRLIDEWQLIPILWDGVRNKVDELHDKGLYILTGSTTVDKEKIMHSGTGRIPKLMMYPMSLFESGESNGKIAIKDLFEDNSLDIDGIKSDLSFDDLLFVMCRGGWPEVLSLENRDDQLLIANSYLNNICDIEISSADGVNHDSEKVMNLMKSYARNISTLAKDTTIMKDLRESFGEISNGTYYNYVSTLRKMYVIQNVYAWSPNIRSVSTMKSTTKKEFIDPSIAVAALNLSPDKLLKDLNTLGFIFETLCYRDLKVYSNELGGKVHYFRKSDTLEVDCVLVLNDGRYGLIEFKLGKREIDKASKHLLKVNDLIKDEIKNKNTKIEEPSFLAVITGGEYAYTRPDGVKILPIGCLR